MKKLLILILICFAQNTFSQTTNVPDKSDLIYDIKGIDVKPEFPGSATEFNTYLDKNFIKPADKPKMKGKIYFTFIIEKDGSLSDIKVIRDLGYGTAEEALRVIKTKTKWNPGKYKNKEVRTLNSGMITIN